jgi:hypothetical protein
MPHVHALYSVMCLFCILCGPCQCWAPASSSEFAGPADCTAADGGRHGWSCCSYSRADQLVLLVVLRCLLSVEHEVLLNPRALVLAVMLYHHGTTELCPLTRLVSYRRFI